MPQASLPGLPNLILAGVTKAGTSSLHRYLGQHPDVGLADVKEVDHYAPMVHGQEPPALTDYARHFRGCVGAPWRLDASPRYFIGGPALVRRLADDLERPKVLIAIREPTARMWSSFTYKHSKGRLPDGMRFSNFIERCERVATEGLVRHPDHSMYRTLATGVYADYLPDWFDVLGADVRVVFFDDLASGPAKQVAALCEWLQIDSGAIAEMDFEARNTTVQPRSQMLRRTAHRVNARLSRVAGDDSALKRSLSSSYQRINAKHSDLRLSDADRDRVDAFYLPTLPPLHLLLAHRGYADVPSWLAGLAG